MTFTDPTPVTSQSLARPESRAPRKILLLAPEMFSAEGGIARILQNYWSALSDSKRAATSTCISLNDSASSGGTPETSRLIFQGCAKSKLKFIFRALRAGRHADVLLCGHIAQLPVAWAVLKFKPTLKYYLVAHGIEVWRRFSFFERLALRKTERIICVSAHTREQMRQYTSLPAERFCVISNCLNRNFTVGAGVPLGSSHSVLVVSRLAFTEPYKGIDRLIAAMPLVRERIPAATLRIVGRGDDQPRLRELATRLGLEDVVIFCGYLPDLELGNEYSSCRLFALPSTQEGFGLVFLEAMARGRPCLGARAGGVPEVIDEDSGVLVENTSPAVLASALVLALRKRWDEKLIRQRAEQFTFKSFQQRVEKLILP